MASKEISPTPVKRVNFTTGINFNPFEARWIKNEGLRGDPDRVTPHEQNSNYSLQIALRAEALLGIRVNSLGRRGPAYPRGQELFSLFTGFGVLSSYEDRSTSFRSLSISHGSNPSIGAIAHNAIVSNGTAYYGLIGYSESFGKYATLFLYNTFGFRMVRVEQNNQLVGSDGSAEALPAFYWEKPRFQGGAFASIQWYFMDRGDGTSGRPRKLVPGISLYAGFEGEGSYSPPLANPPANTRIKLPEELRWVGGIAIMGRY